MPEDQKNAQQNKKSIVKKLKTYSINLLKPKPIILAILLLSLFLTIYSAQQRQDIRQKASVALFWQPAPLTNWQWQLTGAIDTSADAVVFVIDLFDNDASVISDLHSKNKKVVCSMSVGTQENWRPDANNFPANTRGNTVPNKQNERFLDIKNIEALAPVIGARLDLCKQKGFDAVLFENDDTYSKNTGFYLLAHDQINYNKWLAGEAHKRGLSAGLKNDFSQISNLTADFDFAVIEDCFNNFKCNSVKPFTDANKAVFNAEYTTDVMNTDTCFQSYDLNISTIKKNINLDAYRESCLTDEEITINPISISITPLYTPILTPTPTTTPTSTPPLTPTNKPTSAPTSGPTGTPITPTPTLNCDPSANSYNDNTNVDHARRPVSRPRNRIHNNLIQSVLDILNNIIKLLNKIIGITNPTSVILTIQPSQSPTANPASGIAGLPPCPKNTPAQISTTPTVTDNPIPTVTNNPTPTSTPTPTTTPTSTPPLTPTNKPTSAPTSGPTGTPITPTPTLNCDPSANSYNDNTNVDHARRPVSRPRNRIHNNLIQSVLDILNNVIKLISKIIGITDPTTVIQPSQSPTANPASGIAGLPPCPKNTPAQISTTPTVTDNPIPTVTNNPTPTSTPTPTTTPTSTPPLSPTSSSNPTSTIALAITSNPSHTPTIYLSPTITTTSPTPESSITPTASTTAPGGNQPEAKNFINTILDIITQILTLIKELLGLN